MGREPASGEDDRAQATLRAFVECFAGQSPQRETLFALKVFAEAVSEGQPLTLTLTLDGKGKMDGTFRGPRS